MHFTPSIDRRKDDSKLCENFVAGKYCDANIKLNQEATYYILRAIIQVKLSQKGKRERGRWWWVRHCSRGGRRLNPDPLQ